MFRIAKLEWALKPTHHGEGWDMITAQMGIMEDRLSLKVFMWLHTDLHSHPELPLLSKADTGDLSTVVAKAEFDGS